MSVLFGDHIVVKNCTVINGVDSFEELPFAGQEGDVFFRNGIIAEACEEDATVIDGTGCFLVPGLVDLQANDFRALTRKHPPTRFRSICEALLKEGVTSFVLTSLAMPWDDLIEYLSDLHAFRGTRYAGEQVFENAAGMEWSFENQLLGAMVEGTFMNPRFCGCHNPDFVYPLTQPRLEQVVATGSVFAVNIAPELEPAHALEMIEQLTARKEALVAVGHAQPTGYQLRKAIERGAKYAIHLGNGATFSSWKRFHEGGMMEEALRNDDFLVTIIGDGFHVAPGYVRDWIARKDLSRSMFVTDRAFSLDSPERDFSIFGIEGRKERTPMGSLLHVVGPDTPPIEEYLREDSDLRVKLFGAEVTMLEIFQNALSWYSQPLSSPYTREHRAYDLHSALSVAVTLCCWNQCLLAGRAHHFGRIAPGYAANCLLIRVGPDKKVSLEKVFVGK